jgi:prepilin-type N-terminal cleavage/methylation domain-containing protein
MKTSQSHRGFTLVEIMVVVTIIGILATLAQPAFKAAGLSTKASTFVNDVRVFSEGFYRYAQENGKYPGVQRGRDRFPPDMDGYINETAWRRTTPLGGWYSWDDFRGNRRSGHKGAIMIIRSNLKMTELRAIDRIIDDGNISTGILQIRNGGRRIYYILEK